MMDGVDGQHLSLNRHHSGVFAPSSSPPTPSKSQHKSNNHDNDHDKSRKSIGGSQLSSRKNASNKDQHTHQNQQTTNASHADLSVGQYNHHNHPHTSLSGINGLMMLIDGLGLALICAATILESYELWHETFSSHWESNPGPISLWIAGKCSQIVGVLFLIGHAATFQIFPDIERFGMFLLTIGPSLSIAGSYSFQHQKIPSFLYNRQWMSSETVELIGISILDISLIDMEEHFVLIAEVTGFILLCCAAMIQFEYFTDIYMPNIFMRMDMIHSSECFGLIMLIVVAFGQYKIKLAKHEHDLAVHNKLQGVTTV